VIDTNRTIEIEGSPARPLVFITIGAVMALFAFMLAFPLADSGADLVLKIIFYSAAAFFGLCAAIALRSLFASRGAVVTISPHGLRATRVAAEPIPWSAVRGISTWDYTGVIAWSSGQSVIVLAIDPAVEKTLTLTLPARLMRRPNRWLGADGLCFGAQDLNIDYDTLLGTTIAFWRAHSGRA
jgi:hypothetical protein